MNMGWERILPLKIYSNFKTWIEIVNIFFVVKTMWHQFPNVLKTTPISHVYYTYAKLLTSMEIGLSTLYPLSLKEADITFFRSITMFNETDDILQNIPPYAVWMWGNIVSPIEHCYWIWKNNVMDVFRWRLETPGLTDWWHVSRNVDEYLRSLDDCSGSKGLGRPLCSPRPTE